MNLLSRFALGGCLLLLAFAPPAYATERWSCWTPLGKAAVGTDFLIDGTTMRQDTSGSHYGPGWTWQVLRNDGFSVLALWAPVNRHGGKVNLTVWTILINKTSGAFVSAQAYDTMRGGIEHGRCYRGHPPKGAFWKDIRPIK